jgi:hypothetical protein
VKAPPVTLSALALVALAGALPGEAPGLPAAIRSDRIYGIEVVSPPGEGVFAGVARGDLPGVWQAGITHTPLRPGATITGGSFSLTTLRGGHRVTLRGRLAPGGSIRLVSAGSGCANQRYRVTAALTGLGSRTWHGRVLASLVHYRHRLLGICLTYAATVRGTLTLEP